MKYKIPHAVLTTFVEHAANNFGAKAGRSTNNGDGGNHIETMAFLIGHKDGDDAIIATEIIFPLQFGTSDHVEDLGKQHSHYSI